MRGGATKGGRRKGDANSGGRGSGGPGEGVQIRKGGYYLELESKG